MYTEILRGQAMHEMHGSTMSCSAVFGELTLDSQQVTLNVLCKGYIKPDHITGTERSYNSIIMLLSSVFTDKPVNVTLTLKKESVIDGDNVIMECSANSNPPPHTYSWFSRQMGQDFVINTTEGKLLYENITQKTLFSCVAYNDAGAKQSDWLDLDVQCRKI